MNHPNPHDQPEEPECDACQGAGVVIEVAPDSLIGRRRRADCVLCNGTGTLSQAAQRELGATEAEQRKIDERWGK